METLYHRSNILLDEINQCFSRIQSNQADKDAILSLENEIQDRIDQIKTNSEKLDVFVSKEPVARRHIAKLKVDQLKYDCSHLQAALRNMQHKRFQKEEEIRNREELLNRKYAPNEDTSIFIDHGLQHNTNLRNVNRGMDDLLGSGEQILGSLRDQRQTLSGARKRVLEIANTLGMSNTVMRLIEKRAFQDKYILFGGMFVTCVLMFLIFKYLT